MMVLRAFDTSRIVSFWKFLGPSDINPLGGPKAADQSIIVLAASSAAMDGVGHRNGNPL